MIIILWSVFPNKLFEYFCMEYTGISCTQSHFSLESRHDKGLHLTYRVLLLIEFISLDLEIKCAQALNLWRNSSSEINSELYKGYQRGNSDGQVNEIVSGT